MDVIKIKGYSTLHPNMGYYRKSEIHQFEDVRDRHMEIVLLSTFTSPTRDEIITRAGQIARSVVEKKGKNLSPIEMLFKHTCEGAIEAYAQEKSHELELLRNYMPRNSYLLDHERYLQIHTGIASLEAISGVGLSDGEDYFDRYLRVLTTESIEKESIKLLLENGKFPAKKKLDEMLRMRICRSGVFSTTTEFFDYDKADQIMRAVYTGLTLPDGRDKLSLLVDKSSRILDDLTAQTQIHYHNAREGAKMLQELLLSAISEEEGENQGIFDSDLEKKKPD